MTQSYPTVTGTSLTLAAYQDALGIYLESLRTSGYGGSAPSSPVQGQLWYDGTELRIWSGAAWNIVGVSRLLYTIKGDIDASNDGIALYYAAAAGTVERVRLLPVTTVATDGTDYFSVQLDNVTQTLDLFATAPGTDSEDWTAGTVKDYTPDQNQTVAADDILRITISGTGAPTALSELGVEITILHT